ncbi:MAG: tRNA threonylcarbamoyladenosine biosynthesis protein TsaB [Candidatus Azotimanducaceae bacterium]|jgi:tRNA threonylcarbamoyladenosine biosynthesis protein TsaB
MNILAIDTSTTACVLGLRFRGEELVRFEHINRTHSLELLPRIVALLADAELQKTDLDLLVFGRGPGSFTGLRITVGVVQGLAFGLDIPVVGVSTLACIAQGRHRRSLHQRSSGSAQAEASHVVVAQIARQQELFYGAYEIREGVAQLVGKEAVHLASDVPLLPQAPWVGVGSGWQFADDINASSHAEVSDITLEAFPEAEDLLFLGAEGFRKGAAVKAEQAIPEYLREQVATPPKPKT